MSSAVEIVGQQLIDGLQDLAIVDQTKPMENCTEEIVEINRAVSETSSTNNHHGFCAICLNKIVLQETALVKGCEHAYCVTCILRWASYKNEPTCPQCKHPFEFLNIHRTLDGSIRDYMFEESVCLLLRASWFNPLVVVERDEVDEETENYYYEDDEEDLNEIYLNNSSSLRIGNRRWGDNGYVRGGRQEARPRPVYNVILQDSGVGPSRQPKKNLQDSGVGPSRQPKKKETTPSKENVGRRAKRALKREAADVAAAAKHEERLVRMGRK